MHQSSDSIASLAAALAKAQAELTNPERTQIATVELGESAAAGRSFRYAPLSSGLEIVRKTLGQHAIAVIQTTAIDHATDTVKLTPVLAHSSGEWISSDWPDCRVADKATPHRMGAALTKLDKSNGAANGGNGATHHSDALHRGSRATLKGPPRPVLNADQSHALRDRLLTELADLRSVEAATAWAHAKEREK